MTGPAGRAAAGEGLFVSLRRLGGTTLEFARIRLELLSTEVEQQKLAILSAFVWAALGSMCAAVGLVLLSGFIVLMFWDGYRLQALGVLAGVYGVAAVLILRYALRKIQTPSGAFAASRAELLRDHAALAPRQGAEPPPGAPK